MCERDKVIIALPDGEESETCQDCYLVQTAIHLNPDKRIFDCKLYTEVTKKGEIQMASLKDPSGRFIGKVPVYCPLLTSSKEK